MNKILARERELENENISLLDQNLCLKHMIREANKEKLFLQESINKRLESIEITLETLKRIVASIEQKDKLPVC